MSEIEHQAVVKPLADTETVDFLKHSTDQVVPDDSNAGKECPSKAVRGAAISADYDPASVDLHPRLIEALSEVHFLGSSGLSLLNRPVMTRGSNCAKSTATLKAYATLIGDLTGQNAIMCGFSNVDTFRAFCALGDIDPGSGRDWSPYKRPEILGLESCSHRIWASRTKDIVIETSSNPLEENGYCHYFGLTGVADKAIAMWDFMHDKYDEQYEGQSTIWAAMIWDREYC